MTTWTASGWWRAYVADCGPYIGPWPPSPPIPANIPAVGGVDYFLSTQSVSDVATAPDPAGLDVWRYSTGSIGSGLGADPIHGAHLFVIVGAGTPPFTWPTSAPADDALSFVPALYAAGGSGAPVPDPAGGHWSDWLDYPPTLAYEGTYPMLQYTEQPTGTDATSASLVDIEPLESDFLASIGDPVTVAPIGGAQAAARFGISANKDPFGLPKTRVGFDADGEIASDWVPNADFGLASLLALIHADPVVFDALVEGIDYTAPPTGPEVDYEDGRTSSFNAWTEVSVAWTTTTDDGGSSPTLLVSSLSGSAYAVDGPVPATGGSGTAPATGIGLGSITITAPDGGTTDTETWDVSGAADEFYVHTYLTPPGTPPVGDYSTSGSKRIGWLWSFDSIQVAADVTYPRWRYWIPGGIRWHTVGGHWSTVGGETMKILTPGVGWVDVVDGPA